MRRVVSLLAVVGSIALTFGLARPVAAEDPPPPQAWVQLDVTVTGYLGGMYGQWARFGVNCGDSGGQTVDVPLSNDHGVSDPVGPFPVGAGCNAWISEWPWPGQYGAWSDNVVWDPGQAFMLVDGTNTIGVTMVRDYVGSLPPEDVDTSDERVFDVMTIDRVLLNRTGGIMVEGTAFCDARPFMNDGWMPSLGDGGVVANVNWEATQYAGRKTAITATYESGIGFYCWESANPADPGHWGTYYAYPSGAPQWIYAKDGKFGAGTILVDALANTSIVTVTQDWDPTETYFDVTIPYRPGCDDANDDGFCVRAHLYYGPAQAALKPIRVK